MNNANKLVVAAASITTAAIVVSVITKEESSESSSAQPLTATPDKLIEEPPTPFVEKEPSTPAPAPIIVAIVESGEVVDRMFETVDPALVDDSILHERVNHETVNRYRVVNINTELIRTYMREEFIGKPLYLPLFDDVTIMGIASIAKSYYEGDRAGFGSWAGSVNGDMKSIMSIVISSEGETLIRIHSDEGIYNVSRLRHTPFHLVLDLSPSRRVNRTNHGIDVSELEKRINNQQK